MNSNASPRDPRIRIVNINEILRVPIPTPTPSTSSSTPPSPSPPTPRAVHGIATDDGIFIEDAIALSDDEDNDNSNGDYYQIPLNDYEVNNNNNADYYEIPSPPPPPSIRDYPALIVEDNDDNAINRQVSSPPTPPRSVPSPPTRVILVQSSTVRELLASSDEEDDANEQPMMQPAVHQRDVETQYDSDEADNRLAMAVLAMRRYREEHSDNESNDDVNNNPGCRVPRSPNVDPRSMRHAHPEHRYVAAIRDCGRLSPQPSDRGIQEADEVGVERRAEIRRRRQQQQPPPPQPQPQPQQQVQRGQLVNPPEVVHQFFDDHRVEDQGPPPKRTRAEELQAMEEFSRCMVCYEFLFDLRWTAMRCGHKICLGCIAKQVFISTADCPECRTPIDLNYVNRMY